VHGSNIRNLSVLLSLSQNKKNAMFFLLLLMSSFQQNWKRKGQKTFCLQVRGLEGGGAGEEMAQTMYAYMNK
jgi:hypothetical protein